MTRVLCAVDIDDPAGSAFAQALAIARARSAGLLLVCAVAPGEPLHQRAAERLAFLLRIRRVAEAAGVGVHASVQAGEAAEIFLRNAIARRADLIVIGVEHGRGDGRPWGAVAEDVLRAAPCPTLIVPAGAPERPAFSRVVCAVDIAADATSTLDGALRVTAAGGLTLTVLHVTSPFDNGDTVANLEAVIPPEARPAAVARVIAGDVASEILGMARSVSADLLVIGARRRSRVGRKLFGVTRQILASTHCPVLAVPLAPVRQRRLDREAA